MTYPGDLLGDIELLKYLADLSDEISSARFLAQDLKIESKPDLSPVTDADRAVEAKIREVLKAQRPNDKIVGEEFGSAEDIQVMDRYWVIDPIDGTKNFLRGLPIWATLIGLVHRNENGQDRVIAGMVSSPALFRRWYAAEGFGAFTEVNSGAAIQIKASNVKEISDASISFSDLVGWGPRKNSYLAFMDKAWRARGIGDFWSHMLVAEGAVDVAIEPKLAIWDMAALDIVVREAGGRFTNTAGVDGSLGGSGLSTNSVIHQKIVDKLNGR